LPIQYSFTAFPGVADTPVEQSRITVENNTIGGQSDNSGATLQLKSIFKHQDGLIGLVHSRQGTTFKVLDLNGTIDSEGNGTLTTPVVITSARTPSFTVENQLAGHHGCCASIRLAYQDAFLNRVGVLRAIYLDENFTLTLDKLSDGATTESAITFSTANPTMNISTLATRNNRTIIAYTANDATTANGIFVKSVKSESGTETSTSQTHAEDGSHVTVSHTNGSDAFSSRLSTATLSSTASVKLQTLDLIPIGCLETDASGVSVSSWLMGFVYMKTAGVSEKGRVVLQRLVDGAIVQDVVGEAVHLTDDFVIGELSNDRGLTTVGTPEVYDVSNTHQLDATVTVWASGATSVSGLTTTRLRFQDVSTSFSSGGIIVPALASSVQLRAATIDFAQLASVNVTLFTIVQDATIGSTTVVVQGSSGIATGDHILHAHSAAIPLRTVVESVSTDLIAGTMTVSIGTADGSGNITSTTLQGDVFIGQQIQVRQPYTTTTLGNAFSPESHDLANAFSSDSNVISSSLIDGSTPGFPGEIRRCCLAKSALASIVTAGSAVDDCTIVAYVENASSLETLNLRLLIRSAGVQDVSIPLLIHSDTRVDLISMDIQSSGTLSARTAIVINTSDGSGTYITHIKTFDLRVFRQAFDSANGHSVDYKLDPAALSSNAVSPIDLTSLTSDTYVVNDIYGASLPSTSGSTVTFTDSSGNVVTSSNDSPPVNFQGVMTLVNTNTLVATHYQVNTVLTSHSFSTNEPMADTVSAPFRHMVYRNMYATTIDDVVMMLPTFSNSVECECTFVVQRSIAAPTIARFPMKAILPPGDYNSLSLLATALNNLLYALDHHFYVIADNSTFKLRIVNRFSAFSLIFSRASYTLYNISNEEQNSETGFGYVIGFRNFQDAPSSFGADGSGNAIQEVVSNKRVDLAGRSYLYLHLSANPEINSIGQPISAESSFHSASFARIPLAVGKGDIMYFMSNAHYSIHADVQIDQLKSLRVRLTRYHIVERLLQEQQEFLYQPQGVEHSFSLRIHCKRDEHGSAEPIAPLTRIARFERFNNEPLGVQSDYSSDYSDE
jgi:hypothetical protein